MKWTGAEVQEFSRLSQIAPVLFSHGDELLLDKLVGDTWLCHLY